MKIKGILLAGILISTPFNLANADTDGNLYLGFGVSSLALDGSRVTGIPTRSPGHTPKIGNLFLGYQFNNRWSLDLSLGTDLSSNVNTNQFAINGYRFFGDGNWKPYVSVGISRFSIDDALVDQTDQVQTGFGLSGDLTDNLELRLGYQYALELDDTSYNDDIYTLSLNWHFRKPAAAPVAVVTPQPESVPQKKVVTETIELLVQFDFDKSSIASVYKPQFDNIAQVLTQNPDISMIVEGHTCWIGTEQYNQSLSERRADAVRKRFISEYSISADRISIEGYGESRPVADNKSAEGRQKNRRAIAVILKPKTVTE